ncbi:MAG: tRNA lysidine(34) synthetase TilS [bacterium]
MSVAVSGGVDSMALLDWLARFHPPALVLHVHHHLRPEADLDRDLVVERCRALGLPYQVLDVDVRRNNSIQQQARSARYGAMVQASLRAGLTDLVTAHHRDDAVETSAGAGQSDRQTTGISPARFMEHWGITLHRPLLHVGRQDILAYAAKHRVLWREDASNADPKYLRARLRMQDLTKVELDSVRPLPEYRRVGADTIRVKREDASSLAEIVGQVFPTCAVSAAASHTVQTAINAETSQRIHSHGLEIWIGADIVVQRTLGCVRPINLVGSLRWGGQLGSHALWSNRGVASKLVREKLRTARRSRWYRVYGPVGLSETDPRRIHLLDEDAAGILMSQVDTLEF